MTAGVSEVLPRFWSAGAETAGVGGATLTYRAGLVAEPTATFLHDVRPDDVHGLDVALERAAQVIHAPCPRVFLGSRSPVWVEAELVVRDWHVESNVQLVLPADRALPRPGLEVAIRPAHDADWVGLRRLFRADHEEEDRKFGRPVRSEHRTDAVVEARRALPRPVRYFVAEAGGGVAGFVAGWPGEDGLGLVEDLFVHPDHRGRGLATALIGSAVRWARAGGAGPVVIGAQPEDTPKHLYARLGFVPAGMVRAATRPRHETPGDQVGGG